MTQSPSAVFSFIPTEFYLDNPFTETQLKERRNYPEKTENFAPSPIQLLSFPKGVEPSLVEPKEIYEISTRERCPLPPRIYSGQPKADEMCHERARTQTTPRSLIRQFF